MEPHRKAESARRHVTPAKSLSRSRTSEHPTCLAACPCAAPLGKPRKQAAIEVKTGWQVWWRLWGPFGSFVKFNKGLRERGTLRSRNLACLTRPYMASQLKGFMRYPISPYIYPLRNYIGHPISPYIYPLRNYIYEVPYIPLYIPSKDLHI